MNLSGNEHFRFAKFLLVSTLEVSLEQHFHLPSLKMSSRIRALVHNFSKVLIFLMIIMIEFHKYPNWWFIPKIEEAFALINL